MYRRNCQQPPLILFHQPESAFAMLKFPNFTMHFFPLIISPTLPLSPKEVLIHFFYLSIRISISKANNSTIIKLFDKSVLFKFYQIKSSEHVNHELHFDVFSILFCFIVTKYGTIAWTITITFISI